MLPVYLSDYLSKGDFRAKRLGLTVFFDRRDRRFNSMITQQIRYYACISYSLVLSRIDFKKS